VSGALYTRDILRLALAAAQHPRLAAPHASVERRARPCGSRITLDLALAPDGRVGAIGLAINACAIGQAAAGLVAEHAPGRSVDDLVTAALAVEGWLAGDSPALPDWPGMGLLVPALAHPARHGAMLLPFAAAAEAAGLAVEARRSAA
jgi:NifU-like protein involved in Fe-S cluster formation